MSRVERREKARLLGLKSRARVDSSAMDVKYGKGYGNNFVSE